MNTSGAHRGEGVRGQNPSPQKNVVYASWWGGGKGPDPFKKNSVCATGEYDL